VRSGSTSRPRYVLQVGHTRCGSFGWWQTGHSLTRGAFRRCVALRLSRRVEVCLRFGTAMAAEQYSRRLLSSNGQAPLRLYRGFAFA